MSYVYMVFQPSGVGRGGGIQRHRQQGDLISLLLYFQSKESRLKMDPKETEWKSVV
jgi:hypothetical protein